MARRPIRPTETRFPASEAVGSAACPDSRRVDLVWRDPETGERLTVGLEASSELIDCLRRDGFEVDDSGSGGFAAA